MSLTNRYLADCSGNVKPEVGMPATLLYWSDRKPATVIRVSRSGREVAIQRDRATRIDDNGMSEGQVYEFQRDPGGLIEVFTLRKNGRWVEKGMRMGQGLRLGLGYREEYYDYSF